jgi:hypothetical protein
MMPKNQTEAAELADAPDPEAGFLGRSNRPSVAELADAPDSKSGSP